MAAAAATLMLLPTGSRLEMRLQLGSGVDSTGEPFGTLADVVIDPVARVETDAVTLSLREDEVAALPAVTARRRRRTGDHGSRR